MNYKNNTELTWYGCITILILILLWIFGIPWVVMMIFNHFSLRLHWDFLLSYWETFGVLLVLSIILGYAKSSK